MIGSEKEKDGEGQRLTEGGGQKSRDQWAEGGRGNAELSSREGDTCVLKQSGESRRGVAVRAWGCGGADGGLPPCQGLAVICGEAAG